MSPRFALAVALASLTTGCKTRLLELLPVEDLAVVPVDMAPPADLAAPDLAPRIVDPLDILFVVVNEPYTRALRERVAAAGPQLFPSLIAGSRDWHVGLVTADLGGNGVAWPQQGCTTSGDRGVLLPRSEPACAALRGRYMAGGAAGNNFVGDPGTVFSTCVARGTAPEGCMFQQPWNAAFLALDSITTVENAGFLRKGGRLLVVFIVDGDDCSVPPGSDLFDVNRPYGGPDSRLSDRCMAHGNVCAQGQPLGDGVWTGCRPIAASNGLLYGADDFKAGVARLRNLKDDVELAYLAGPSTTRLQVQNGYFTDQCFEGDMGYSPLDLGIPGPQEVAIPSPRINAVVDSLGGYGNAGVCAPDYSGFFQRIGQIAVH